MGVKRGNLKLISGLLLPSFIRDYILIRVKERERVERERNEEDSKDFEKIAC